MCTEKRNVWRMRVGGERVLGELRRGENVRVNEVRGKGKSIAKNDDRLRAA